MTVRPINSNIDDKLQHETANLGYTPINPSDQIYCLKYSKRKPITIFDLDDKQIQAHKVNEGTWFIEFQKKEEPLTPVHFMGSTQLGLWDTGASCNAISRLTLEQLKSLRIFPHETYPYKGTLRGPSNETLQCTEMVKYTFRVGSTEYRDVFNVLEINDPMLILGYTFMRINNITMTEKTKTVKIVK